MLFFLNVVVPGLLGLFLALALVPALQTKFQGGEGTKRPVSFHWIFVGLIICGMIMTFFV